MATVPAILLSILLPAAEPLSPAELDLAVAALEESLSRYTAIEAHYSVRYEWLPGRASALKLTSPAPATITWVWKKPKERISTVWTKVPDMPKQADEELLFDGAKTYHLILMEEVAEQPDRVAISPGPPSKELSSLNYLSSVAGVRLYMREGNLLSVIAKAKSSGDISGTRADEKLTVSLGALAANRGIEVELDGGADHRLTAIRVMELDTGKNFHGHKWEFVVVEYQSVADETTGEKIWFPLHARFMSPDQLIHLNVASVRINHVPADDAFVWREPKSGTEVTEVTVAGGPGKTWSVGGEAAEQERMKQLVAQAEAMAEEERERLQTVGVSVNASPPSSNSRWFWAGGGCLLLASAWILSWILRRRAG